MIYLRFAQFLLPLVLMIVVQEIGGQVLNGGMARMPHATETLASYGLAWGIVTFVVSPLLQAQQLGLVLVDSQQALRRTRTVVLAASLCMVGCLALLAFSPLGPWVIQVLHGLDRSLGQETQMALAWLALTPALNGLIRFYAGILMRVRRTGLVSAATAAGMGVSVGATFLLLPAALIQQRPIRLPLLVTYSGLLVEIVVIWWGYRRYVHGTLPDLSHATGQPGRAPGYGSIIRFFWPLALIMAVQGFSRPLINLFVSRSADSATALAVLTVVYSLGHLPYGWLNDLRTLPASFHEEKDAMLHVRRFALTCGLAVFALMLVMYWTPVRTYILRTLIGVDERMAMLAAVPLMLFAFFPLPVTVRAYLHGVGLVERRTRALAPSGPARVGAIVVALVILSWTPLPGAVRGVAALLTGFVVETIVVWLSLYPPFSRAVVPGPPDQSQTDN